MMAAEMLCVVDTGMPKCEARPMIVAEVVSAAKPCTGCSSTILCPSVLMIRQPPAAVPAAMTTAQTTLIQVAISRSWPGCRASGCARTTATTASPSRLPVRRAGRQGQGDDSHRLLRVVRAVHEAHACGAEHLRFAEHGVHRSRLPVAQQRVQQAHEEKAEHEAGRRRAEHRHDDFPQQPFAGVPMLARRAATR